MDNTLKLITDFENLNWAWKKFLRACKPGDIWYDEVAIACFEADIENEFNSIKQDILSRNYHLTPLKPIGFPKYYDKENKKSQTRQAFWVSIRDQITWLAVINIIGPDLDFKMPYWSYGNRLYISVWKEEEDSNNNHWKFGWYRSSTGQIYRKWNQSWPLFRRSISVTSRIMAFNNRFRSDTKSFIENELYEPAEVNTFEQNDYLPEHLRIKYFDRNFWTKPLTGDIFWCGIDFEKFYPNVKKHVFAENINKYLSEKFRSKHLIDLIDRLLQFPIDTTDWTKDELEELNISGHLVDSVFFDGIPTGLLVAGFIANVALLDVDNKVDKLLEQSKNIAHFRFVDDHVVIATSFDDLVNWTIQYRNILKDQQTGAIFNLGKTEPQEFVKYLNQIQNDKEDCDKSKGQDDITVLRDDAIQSTKLDPRFPVPLMTQTLAKVSIINNTEFELLDEDEERQMLADLEHLLGADLPDNELRKDTRISFAATMLSRLVPRKTFDHSAYFSIREKLANAIESFEKLQKNRTEKNVQALKKDIIEQINYLKDRSQLEWSEIETKKVSLKRHIFNLLIKAVRENYQKVRLWVRLVEYCRNTGYFPIKQIFGEVENLNNTNYASKLTTEYIYTLILQVITDNIILSVKSVLSPEYPFEERQNSWYFIKSLLSFDIHNFFNEKNYKKYYFQINFELFRFCLGTSLFVLRNNFGKNKELFKEGPSELIKVYQNAISQNKLMDWRTDKIQAVQLRKNKKLTQYSYWVIRKLSYNVEEDLIKKIVRFLGNDLYSKRILSLFPSYVNSSHIPKKLLFNVIEDQDEGWIADLIYKHHHPYKTIVSNKIDNLVRKVEQKDDNYITIYDWITWLSKEDYIIENEEYVFDPRKSEWTCLEIVKQVAELIYEKSTQLLPPDELNVSANDLYYNVSPHNYLMPIHLKRKVKSPLFWEKWKEKFVKNEVILKIKNPQFLIEDKRFQLGSFSSFINPEINSVFGLGTLLICLITRDTTLPKAWFLENQNVVNINYFRDKIKEVPISSLTYNIIESCFSMRNRETMYWIPQLKLDKFRLEDDTARDPIEINGLRDFIEEVNTAQNVLEKYQISMHDSKSRQLIPISLEQISRTKNVFLDNK